MALRADESGTADLKVLRASLALFLPFVTLAFCLFAYLSYSDFQKSREILGTREIHSVDLAKTVAETYLGAVVSDALTLSAYPELRLLLDTGAPSDQRSVEEVFLSFSANKGFYDQVRFLDDKGMEVVRVNHNGHSDRGVAGSVVVPEDRLQDKAGRYYFAEAFGLDRGRVYVSRLDLNVEEGAVERPLKPMIRFGTPVFDREGRKRGVVLLNYLAERLIRDIDRAGDATRSRLMLLNARGYWLKSPRPEDEWGFMFEDRADRTFAGAYPAAWEQIAGRESGRFLDESGLFTFASVRPAASENSENSWKIVAHVPSEVLGAETKAAALGWLRGFGLFATLAALASWRLAVARVGRDRMQEALRRSEERMRAVVEDQTEIISRFGADMKLTFVNDACCRYLNRTREELLGQSFLSFAPVEERGRIEDCLSSLSLDNPIGAHEHGLIGGKGEISLHRWIDRAFFEGDGRVVEYQSVGRDITRRKRAEEDLRATNRKLVAVESLKEDLTNMIVHDMKSPVTSTIMALDMIAAEDGAELTEGRRDSLRVARRNQFRLSEMIANLLEISRLESGRLRINRARIDSAELIGRVVEGFALAALKEEKTIHVSVDAGAKTIFSDERLLERMLANLLANAVKHSYPMGEIYVEVAPAAERGGILFSVRDFGEGVPKEFHRKIFEKFSQADLRELGHRTDTGLGLTFCKTAVEAFGGSIRLESEPGKGSLFSFWLPDALEPAEK